MNDKLERPWESGLGKFTFVNVFVVNCLFLFTNLGPGP